MKLPWAITVVAVSTALLVQPYGQALGQDDTGRRPSGRSQIRPGPPGFSEAEKEKARIRVGMSKEQQQQLESLFVETSKKSQDLYEQIMAKHMELNRVYDEYDFDRKRESALIREISRLRERLLRVHADSEVRVRRILTREQHERLRAMMKEFMGFTRKGRREYGSPPGSSSRNP
ncbi:MAG: hypothetical protein HUU17_05170 [Chthonomonadales bacterium]|nr:hypothetical protein [Chthonomonadales bacterium]